MPTIAWFYGIAIRMYARDHPPAHFHVVYGEHEANVAIDSGEVIEGALPTRAARLVQEWALAHRPNCARIGAVPGPESSPKRSRVSMLTKVTHLDKLGGFKLRVRFNDGSEGIHDFAAMVQEPGPLLEPLRDENYFARVFLEFGAPTWPNGFDVAPEWLRREMAAAGELAGVAAE